MKHSKLLTVIFFLIPLSSSLGASVTNYGVITHEDNAFRYGNPLLPYSKDKRGNLEQVMKVFKVGESYTGLNKDGIIASVYLSKVTQEPEGDIGESLLEAKKQKPQKLPILFWDSSSVKHEIINGERAILTPNQKILLEGKTKEFFQKALSQLSDPQYTSLEILNPEILAPAKTDIIAIFFPLKLKSKVGKVDSRASSFFLYNKKTDQIVLGKFGHPEWSPEAENINVIKPIFFFFANNAPYCFCRYDDAWEHSGFALIELKSGKIPFVSY